MTLNLLIKSKNSCEPEDYVIIIFISTLYKVPVYVLINYFYLNPNLVGSTLDTIALHIHRQKLDLPSNGLLMDKLYHTS